VQLARSIADFSSKEQTTSVIPGNMSGHPRVLTLITGPWPPSSAACSARRCAIVNEKQKHIMLFIPDIYFMGANKNDPIILELVEKVKHINRSPFFSSEHDLLGTISNYCIEYINAQEMNLIGGQYIGVKTKDRKPILLDNLMEEEYLDISNDAVGIYIPEDEVLIRSKYQWFAYLSKEEILKSKMIISKYIMASIIDTTDEYHKNNEIKSIVAI
jgi:hypothetical protein